MTLTTDHSFHIGEQHLKQGKPCQDFTLSGAVTDTLAFAQVSDGCSSGRHTDIGARLMCLAAEKTLQSNRSLALDTALAESTGQLIAMGRALGLTTHDLLATSLTAVMDTAGSMSVAVYGDGVVAELRGGTLLAHKYEWSENTPFYPIYSGALRTTFVSSEHPRVLTKETWRIEPETVLCETQTFAAQDNVFGEVLSHTSNPHQADTDCIGVFSDGVLQVDGVPWQEVVQRLMAFKNTKGQFAVRRMNRFLQEVKKVGRGPIDDIAMAVIHRSAQSENGGADVTD